MKKIKLTALIAALIAGVGIYFFLKEISKPAEVPHTDVVVALFDIPQNTMITEEMVALRPVANEALQTHCLLDLESAVDHVSAGDIYAGEQVVGERIVRTGEIGDESNTLAYVIENGMRAITVGVNIETGLENFLKPGNRVDIISFIPYEATLLDDGIEEPEESADEPETAPVTGMIVQNVKLLAVGVELRKEGAEEYTTVTLQVTPEQALRIDYAEREGAMLRLILRSPLDNEPVIPHRMDIDTFKEEVSKP